MEWMVLFFIVLWFLIHSARKPRCYRAVRRPGGTMWSIEWKQGIFRGKEKHYLGGGREGYPVYGTAYWNTRKEAEERIYELKEKDEDLGEEGPWILP